MRRTLAVVGGVGLALVLSQFPEYAQQYQQRLGGAVDDANLHVELVRRAASRSFRPR